MTALTKQVDRVEGYGPQVPHLIEEARRRLVWEARGYLEFGVDRAQVPSRIPDQVIWQGGRVVALLRPLADGTLAVIQFPLTGYPIAIDGAEIGGGR